MKIPTTSPYVAKPAPFSALMVPSALFASTMVGLRPAVRTGARQTAS